MSLIPVRPPLAQLHKVPMDLTWKKSKLLA